MALVGKIPVKGIALRRDRLPVPAHLTRLGMDEAGDRAQQ